MNRQYCQIVDHQQLPIYGICLDQNCTSLRSYCNQCMQYLHSKHVTSLTSFEQIQSWIRNRMNSIQEIKKFINTSKEIFEILKFVNQIQEKEINQENMEKLGISQLNMLAYDLTKIDHLLHFSNWKETNKQLLDIFNFCQTMKQIPYVTSIRDQPEPVINQNVSQNNSLQQDQHQKINDKESIMNKPKVQTEQTMIQLQGLEKDVSRLQEITKEFEVKIWSGTRFISTKLQINLTKSNQIQYIHDGSIIRSVQVKDTSINPETLTNLEQIQYLQWKGELENNNKKVGKWIANWMGNTLNDVGGQYNYTLMMVKNMVNGKKQFKIIGAQLKCMKRVSMRMAIEQEIGYIVIRIKKSSNGGIYNQQGEKQGKWNELSERFWDKSQIIYDGEYKNGKKIGNWIIKYEGVEIGGGQYEDYQVNHNLDQDFQLRDINQLFEEHDYYSIIMQNSIDQSLLSSTGVEADQQIHNYGTVYIVNQNKIGKWIELSDGFYRLVKIIPYFKEFPEIYIFPKRFLLKIKNYLKKIQLKNSESQVTYEGQYRNGKKFGKWDIWWKNSYNDKKKIQIGGGFYDEECSVKIGKWIELCEGFWDNCQATFKGEYKNGKKVEVWSIEAFGQQIGGGSYDKEGSNKIGSWIELAKGFYGAAQVIQKGEYQNGKKFGKWDICYRENENQSFLQIGGGSYGESSEVKIGNWVELSDGFWDRSQVTLIGEYKNGKKVGRWSSYLKKNYGDYKNVEIGGGSYNEQDSLKIGEWIDLKDQFIVFQQLVYKGEYKDGKKIGTWVEIEIRKNKTMSTMNYDK